MEIGKRENTTLTAKKDSTAPHSLNMADLFVPGLSWGRLRVCFPVNKDALVIKKQSFAKKHIFDSFQRLCHSAA